MPVACGYTTKVAAFTVSRLIGSLKLSWTTVLVGTAPAPFAGLTAVTDGVVLSAAAPVVNVAFVNAATRFPAMSVSCALGTIV